MHNDDTDERSPRERRTALPLTKAKGETDEVAAARYSLGPTLGATIALHELNRAVGGPWTDVNIASLLGELTRASRDDGATGTDRLLVQAAVLDRLFTHLTTVAAGQKYVSQMAPALNLALKAQAQCRQTLQAVSDIRHPRQYVGTQHVGSQFNAGGHMQVNRDGTGGGTTGGGLHGTGDAHGSARENRPTELTEGTDDERVGMDTRAAGCGGGAGEAAPAVGAVDGTDDARRQGALEDEPLPGRGAPAASRGRSGTPGTAPRAP